jgi:hypothetical protein
MIQVYVVKIAALLEWMTEAEREAKLWQRAPPVEAQQRSSELTLLLRTAGDHCRHLGLRSADKQVFRMARRVQDGNCTFVEFSALLAELKNRILEDLEDQVFFCEQDGRKTQRFFKRGQHENGGDRPVMIEKDVREIFDPAVSAAFPEAIDDLQEACYCLLFARHTAAIFHLMRVIEFGLSKLTRFACLEDPKPSWGSMLRRLETLGHKTRHEDLPPAVKPHIDLVRGVLPALHAIQHAWRNRVSHVQQDLKVPDGRADEQMAWEIMNAVNMFMRLLSRELLQNAETAAEA